MCRRFLILTAATPARTRKHAYSKNSYKFSHNISVSLNRLNYFTKKRFIRYKNKKPMRKFCSFIASCKRCTWTTIDSPVGLEFRVGEACLLPPEAGSYAFSKFSHIFFLKQFYPIFNIHIVQKPMFYVSLRLMDNNTNLKTIDFPYFSMVQPIK